MGDKISLKIEARELRGKKVVKLRKQGMTPAVVYGQDMEPQAIQADSSELRKVVVRAGMHTPINLTGSKRRIAMIKSVDYDPTKRGSIRHVAFHAVNANEPVNAEVPIRLVGEGESVAERSGLIVLQALEKIEVKALPMDLPEALEVSILALAAEGDRVTVGDIVLPAGVEIVEHDDGRADEEDEEKQSVLDLVVANVYEPSSLAAANEAAAGDAEDESQVASEGGEQPVDQPAEPESAETKSE